MIAGQLFDELPRFDNLLGVEACGRLVENQHVRVVNDRLREPDPLAVAFGEFRAQPVRHVVDSSALHYRLNPLPTFRGRHPFDLRHKGEVFDHAHVGIKRRRFRQIPGPAFGLDWLIENVEAGDNRLALGWRDKAGEDAHRRRLAGAVGPQEAEDFAALHAEADVLDGRHAPVALREVLNLYHEELLMCAGRKSCATTVARPKVPALRTLRCRPQRSCVMCRGPASRAGRRRPAGAQPKMLSEPPEIGQVIRKAQARAETPCL